MKFVNDLANLTGASVSASSTPIGHKNKGGNWELDIMANPTVPFSKEALENFEQVLSGGNKPTIVLDTGRPGTSYETISSDDSNPISISDNAKVYQTHPNTPLIELSIVSNAPNNTIEAFILPSMMDGNPLFTNINSDGSVASPSNNFIGDPEIGSTLYYAVTADINGVSVNQQIAVK